MASDCMTVAALRNKLFGDYCELTLDPSTANYNLILSCGNKIATHGEKQQYPDCPARFDVQPQVLCTAGLTGRHYWEVKWSSSDNEHVGVGVAYKGIKRKGDGNDSALGCNANSWYFGHYALRGQAPGLSAWHDNKSTRPTCVPPTGWTRVGVYLNWPEGTLTFYRVTADQEPHLTHIHTFQTKFSEAVYPAFWVAQPNNFVRLLSLKK